MPDKLRFEGTPVVLLLAFGESFRAAMAMELQQDLKSWIILIHITDARRGGYMFREEPVPRRGSFGVLGCFNEQG
jgi:hypothetical protein